MIFLINGYPCDRTTGGGCHYSDGQALNVTLSGFAGFLVWEFKENWKLFRANQPATLRPVMVGSHGETVTRLLRPGFHSGTLPKLFAKLRHAEGRAAGKRYEALHHVREAVRHFVERELLAVLAGSKSWGDGLRLRAGEIGLATNRIRVGLRLGGLGDCRSFARTFPALRGCLYGFRRGTRAAGHPFPIGAACAAGNDACGPTKNARAVCDCERRGLCAPPCDERHWGRLSRACGAPFSHVY